MQRTPLDDIACSIARTVDIIGEWWTPLILRDLFAGMSRFEDIRRDLGIASNVLTARLDRLVEHGIVERSQYQDNPPRHEYLLTEMGLDLYPLFATILAWGDRWLAGRKGPPALLIHEDCGHPTTAIVTCSECGEPLTSDRLRAARGPGGHRGPGTAVIGDFLR